MRILFSFMCVVALGLMGCSETAGTGGRGGDGGTAGDGGTGGMTGQQFPCTEQGIRDAIAEGGGPHTFDCDGPQTVVTAEAIEIDNDVILDGEGILTVGGGPLGAFYLPGEGDVVAELRGMAAIGGGPIDDCGFEGEDCRPAIWVDVGNNELALRDCTVSNSSAAGISNDGVMAILNGTVSENTGVGIVNTGTLTATGSTMRDNNASGIFTTGSLMVIGSTVSDNTGAGIEVDGEEGGLVLTNSTVSGNAEGITASGSPLTLVNSTVLGGVGNPSADGTLDVTGSIIVGACVDMLVTSNGYNIESPGNTCGFDQTGDQSGVTAQQLNLGELADNGGPTMTHALLTDPVVSAAINQLPDAMCEVETDQRGEPRPETGGTMCDVGAFEVQP